MFAIENKRVFLREVAKVHWLIIYMHTCHSFTQLTLLSSPFPSRLSVKICLRREKKLINLATGSGPVILREKKSNKSQQNTAESTPKGSVRITITYWTASSGGSTTEPVLSNGRYISYTAW